MAHNTANDPSVTLLNMLSPGLGDQAEDTAQYLNLSLAVLGDAAANVQARVFLSPETRGATGYVLVKTEEEGLRFVVSLHDGIVTGIIIVENESWEDFKCFSYGLANNKTGA